MTGDDEVAVEVVVEVAIVVMLLRLVDFLDLGDMCVR